MNRIIPALLVLAACAPLPPTAGPAGPVPGEGEVGLLVMAHGGSPAWNQTVADAVAPLGGEMPTVIAYGMADPETLGTLCAELESDLQPQD